MMISQSKLRPLKKSLMFSIWVRLLQRRVHVFASEPGEYLARLCGDLGPGLHRGLGLKLNRKTKPRKPALQTQSSLIKF
jgi:hypothetical protein